MLLQSLQEVSVICSCFSNAAMCYLRCKDGDAAESAAKACIVASEEGAKAGFVVQASLVTKARFRR